MCVCVLEVIVENTVITGRWSIINGCEKSDWAIEAAVRNTNARGNYVVNGLPGDSSDTFSIRTHTPNTDEVRAVDTYAHVVVAY